MSDLNDQCKPLVAVFMVTYNHEKYLDKAIQSVINQRADFKFQLFIGEDKSTDSSITICRKYEKEFPEIVHVISSDTNIGIYRNAGRVFEACIASGAKYIALLEGDDYWCSPDKLQRQVTILESDSTIAASYHNTQFLYSDGVFKTMKKALPETLELKDVVSKYAPFHTSSFVFRTEHFCRPEWYKKIDSVDLAMFVWHVQFGRFVGINEVMSVYRIHSTSLTASSEHRDFFDDRRVILHRMMRGKIEHDFWDKYCQLIQFHSRSSSGSWKRYLPSPIAFYTASSEQLDLSYQMLRMKLDAEVINFEISDELQLIHQGHSNRLFRNFRMWNFFVWRRMNKRSTGEVAESVFFIKECDYFKFRNLFGAMEINVFLLFPISNEIVQKDSVLYNSVIVVDWKNISCEEQSRVLFDWNKQH